MKMTFVFNQFIRVLFFFTAAVLFNDSIASVQCSYDCVIFEESKLVQLDFKFKSDDECIAKSLGKIFIVGRLLEVQTYLEISDAKTEKLLARSISPGVAGSFLLEYENLSFQCTRLL